jgi:uracil-DNA glycosylase
VALGNIAFDYFLKDYKQNGGVTPRPRPNFGHGSFVALSGGVALLGSYHPSQQNTFTGKLTREMFDAVFKRAKALLQEG